MNPRIESARRLLADFSGDLTAAKNIRASLKSPLTAQDVCVRRMCLSHAMVTLLKWFEFSKTYKALLPAECLHACQCLEEELQRRRIQLYRHRCIGRMVDRKNGEALTAEALEAYLNIIMQNDEDGFWDFIGTPSEDLFPTTVLSIAQKTYRHLRQMENSIDSEALAG